LLLKLLTKDHQNQKITNQRRFLDEHQGQADFLGRAFVLARQNIRQAKPENHPVIAHGQGLL
jgi:ribosomal protein S14